MNLVLVVSKLKRFRPWRYEMVSCNFVFSGCLRRRLFLSVFCALKHAVSMLARFDAVDWDESRLLLLVRLQGLCQYQQQQVAWVRIDSGQYGALINWWKKEARTALWSCWFCALVVVVQQIGIIEQQLPSMDQS